MVAVYNPDNPDNLDQKRRRNFFIVASSFGMLLILVFSTIDYLEGDILEVLIDIAMAAILVFSAVGIYKFNADRLVYCIGLNLLNLAILYNSEAEFSHGICPDCAKKLYPEFDLYPETK